MTGRVRDDVPNRRDQRSKAATGFPGGHMDFTRQLVDALQSIDQRQQPRSEQEVATCAFNKLQYHLPLVTSCELRGLLRVLKESLAGKASWPAFRLTTNFIDNIAAGCSSSRPSAAAAATSPATPAPSPAAEHPVLSAAWASAADEPPQQLQDLYQQLNGVVVFLYVAKLLALPAEHAWPFLAGYNPLNSSSSYVDTAGDSRETAAPPQEHQEQQQIEQALASAMAAASLSSLTMDGSSSSSTQSNGVQVEAAAQEVCCEAAVMDEDGDVYEDLGTAASSSSSSSLARAWQQQQAAMHAMYQETAPTSSASASQQEQQQVEAFPGQAEVNRRLLALLQQLCQYTYLAGDHLWQHQQQGSTGQQLLELLRLLGSSHAQQQQELAGAVPLLVGLVVDRIVAAPRDMPHLLPGCWEALGVAPSTSSTSSNSSGVWAGASPSNSSTQQQQQQQQQQAAAGGGCLAPEHVLALNSVLALWQQLQGPSPRAQLWQLLQQHLFSALACCCDQLAYHKPTQRGSATSRGATAVGAAAAASSQASSGDTSAAAAGPEAGALLSEVLLVAGGVEVWVLGRPQGCDLAPAAQSSGLLRSMCQLSSRWSSRWSSHPAAEPLRRAALLLAASSQAVAAWLLAVPGFVAALPTQQPATAAGSSRSSSWEPLHAALWSCVAACHQLALPSAAPVTSSSSGSESPGEQQLAELLRVALEGLGPAPDKQQLQRLHQVLHLMDAVQQAAQRPGIWQPEERRLLQQLHSRLQSAMQRQQQQQRRRRQDDKDLAEDVFNCSRGGAIENLVEGGESSSVVSKAGLEAGGAVGAGAAGPGAALPLLWPSLHTLFKQLLHAAGNKKD